MTYRTSLLVLFAAAPVASAVEPAELKPGLVATYTDGTTAVTRVEPTVALGFGPDESPHPRLRGVATATWKGHINVVRGGTYTFGAVADGGTLGVSVNGKPVLNAGPVELAGGVQPLEATFTRPDPTAGPVRVELSWHGPGFRPEPLPHLFLGHRPAGRPPEFAADAASEHGRFRFEELACARCHKPAADDRMSKTLADRPAPVLTEVAKRAYPGWLDAWLADPKKHRPHTTMPKLFDDTPAGKAERYAVVKYLTSLAAPLDPARPPTTSKDYAKSFDNGRVLFSVTGCAACHQQPTAKKPARDDGEDEKVALQPDDYFYGSGTAVGPAGKYALGAVGSKTRPEPLAAFLKNPLKTHPAGRMPNMVLDDKDALDIARYVCRTTDDGVKAAMPAAPTATPDVFHIERAAKAGGSKDWTAAERQAVVHLPVDEQWKRFGIVLLRSKGCVNCHAVEAAPGKPFTPVAAFPDLAAVRKAGAGKGCLADAPPPGKVPDYKLDARERDAIVAFFKDGLSGAGSKAPAHAARVTLKRFNCLNCHQRDGEGGIPVELAEAMRLLEKSENADDVRPPVLTGVGHKARTSWLTGVLTQAQRARPWMQLRMPQYGESNVGHLPTALPALEGVAPDDAVHAVPLSAEKIAAGRAVVGKSGMGCISCHDISGVPNTGTRGPDLSTINQRVRYDWYVRWLNQPLRMAPGTRMPQAFVDGKSPLPLLNGDGDAQAEAMWAYLSLGPGLPLPDGMEPPKGLVVAVKDRPEVLRTFLKEGGNRAIAVGYPGGMNAAFAADECKLAYAWAGNFVDASPVWDKRGGAPAKLLGPKVWTAPPGHPWGVTSATSGPPDFITRSADPAWGSPLPLEPPRIYTGPKKVAFDGYALNEAGEPTFRYRTTGDTGAELKVAETPGVLKGGVAAGLRRRFEVAAPAGQDVWFLAGSTAKDPRLLGPTGDAVAVDLSAPAPNARPEGTKVVLPADGDRLVVLELSAFPAGSEWRFVKRPTGGWLAVARLPTGEKDRKWGVAVDVWALPKDDPALLRGLAGK